MIEYIEVKNLGFTRHDAKDEVYENRYGREYWWMEYEITISNGDITSIIYFEWDNNDCTINVFKDGKKIKHFTNSVEFYDFFKLFKVN